jgi:hypothetical protein
MACLLILYIRRYSQFRKGLASTEAPRLEIGRVLLSVQSVDSGRPLANFGIRTRLKGSQIRHKQVPLETFKSPIDPLYSFGSIPLEIGAR